MFFQISPVRNEKKKKHDTPEKTMDEIEVLSLAPFSSLPKLSFDNIKIGSVVTRQLLIKNPTNQEVNLFLSKLLPEELNVSYSWRNRVIESGGETVFELTWCPSVEESSRHMISFTDTRKIKRDIPVTFKSVLQRKVPDKRTKTTITRQKSPIKKVTKKYYPTRPTKISPNKYSSPSKKNPPVKKYSPSSVKLKSPTKNYSTPPKRNPIIKKYSPSPVNDDFPIFYRRNLQTSPAIPGKRQAKPTYVVDKENMPSTILDSTVASDMFVSPKNVSFTMNNIQTKVRRETYVLKGSPLSEFEDSLEKVSPAVSPLTRLFSAKRAPLGAFNGDLSLFSNSQRFEPSDKEDDDFASKLNRKSFCFTPSTTPVKNTVMNFTSVIEEISCNRTYEGHESTTLNVSSETYVKANTSGDTFVKSNVSGATYTRDSSVGDLNSLNLSPFSTKASPKLLAKLSPQLAQRRCSSPFNDIDNAKKITQPNFFGGFERQELSCIEEETCVHNSVTRDTTLNHSSTKRRRLNADLSVTSPKKPTTCSAKDWSRKRGAALRVAKKSSGLSVTNLGSQSTEAKRESILEISKRDTNTVIIQNPFILAATNAVDPFMAPNLYVSEKWIDQQEVDLKKWLNALLTPPQELNSEERAIDVAKVWQECKKMELDAVPDKETICNNVHTNAKLNNLRKVAQSLFRSPEMAAVLGKVMKAVDSGKFSIRSDKDIHLNLVLKSEMIGLLLNYNSLWLRIALETIYNEIIPLSSNSDIVGLSTFIVNRVIKDPYLVRKYKSVHAPKYAAEFKKFFLKKFLILVYFLDQAKNRKLIPHDPCLFRKNGSIKESKELLLILARETLFAVGDITKSLKFLGYTVSHVQTYIHEFDYTVNNLGVDLRDGMRLAKVMEIILMKNDLMKNLRVPAISRLQKVHNMKIVFGSLNEAGFQILYDISPKDIVDGHREKTLSFLWQMIYKFEAPLMVKSATTIQRWFRSAPIVRKRRELEMLWMKRENAAKNIQAWYRRQMLIRRMNQYAVDYNLYMKHLKRERAAVKIQSCYRRYVCQKSYENKLQAIIDIQRICRGYLVRNMNMVQIRSTVVIQSYVRMYIARKQFLKLKQSALVIQARYRAQKEMESKKSAYNKLKTAVHIIQQRFRANNLASDQRQRYLQLRSGVISVQRRFRANILCKTERKKYVRTKSATGKIQAWFRSIRAMRMERQRYLQLKQSVKVVEQRFLALKVMRVERQNYKLVKTACINIQEHYRAWISMRIERKRFTELKTAAIYLQQKYRAKKAMEHNFIYYRELRDAVIYVQRKFRANRSMKIEQKKFVAIRSASTKIQCWFRASLQMRKCRTTYLSLKYAVRIFEDRYEARTLMRKDQKEFQKMRCSAVLLQQKYRASVAMRSERNKFCQLKSAALAIQRRFRANRMATLHRTNYLSLKQAAVVVQRRFRAQKDMRACANEFAQLKKTAILLQRRVRANSMMVVARESYRLLLKHTIFIQRKFRANRIAILHRTNYLSLKQAAVVVQRRFRAQRDMRACANEFAQLKKTAIMLQRRVRANSMMVVARESYRLLLKYTIFIQRKFRANRMATLHRTNYLSLKQAAVVVQRRFRAQRDMRACANEFTQLKKTTIILQRRVRANSMMVVARESYRLLLKHTIFIQRKFRANRMATLHRTNYLSLKQAAVVIQRRFRAQRDMRACANEFTQLKKTTIILQRRVRANSMMVVARETYRLLLKHTIFIQRKFRANRLARLHRTNFLMLKQAAVAIQRRFRAQRDMRACSNEFLQLKTTTIMLQRRVRANNMMKVARESYESLRKHTIFIQRIFRANRLTEIQRTNYSRLRTAAIVIQRRFRAQRQMLVCTQEYLLLRKTTVELQRRVRANNMMKTAQESYRSLIRNTIFVQRKFRANKLAKIDRTNYLNLRHAAIVIQRRFRAQRDMRICLHGFVELKKNTIMIQRRFRANQLMKVARDSYSSLLHATITIQRKWRATQLSIEARHSFLRLKCAVVLVQQQWRAKRMGMKAKQQFDATKSASVIIQRRWRALQLGRQVRNDYQQLRIATLVVQQKWRANISMRIHSRNYAVLKSAVIILQRRYRAQVLMKKHLFIYKKTREAAICIQRFYRGCLKMRKEKAEYESKKKAIIQIQSRVRGYIVRQKYAQYFTPEAKEQRRIDKLRHQAAVKIQANWRGHKSRSKEPYDCTKIRKRMQKANAEVVPENTLASKYGVALQTFANESSTLFHIIKALQDIDYVTRRCESKCVEMAQLLPGQLYIMLGATSRSLPEMNACIYSVNILINICKYPKTKKYSFVPDYMDNLLAVMLHWCDKESQLFPTLCTLLWLFAQTPQFKRIILKLPNLAPKLNKIQSMVSRKENMVKRSASKVFSHFSSSKTLSMPSLLPDWGLDYTNNPYVFTNSVHALDSLLNILNI